MTEQLHFHFSLPCIGEGNGNPFQCSCLENPRDRGACWAAVYGVPQSQTRLKRLSSSTIFHWGFLGGSVVKNLPASTRDVGSIPGSGRSFGEGNGNPLQYSCLGNPMDRGAWRGYSPWSHKRVGHDIATKQSRYSIVCAQHGLSTRVVSSLV